MVLECMAVNLTGELAAATDKNVAKSIQRQIDACDVAIATIQKI